MAPYLLSVYQPESEPPPADELRTIMENVAAFDRELRAAGAWVFSGGLEAPSTASVVTGSGDDALVTDGPFVALKEYLGGLTIIDVEDLDAALAWGRRAAAATTLPIEVRPFHRTG